MNTNQILTGPGGIAARLAPSVAAVASQLAESNEMPEALVREMRDSGALRLLTPTELGGTEAPLTTVLEVYEELGRIDASVALQVWNSNFGFIGALLGAEGNARIWRDNQPEPVFANGGTPGRAEVDPDGYRVSGTWRMISGIAHADWVVLSTLVTEGGVTRMTENGPDFRLVAVPADQVTVKDTWHVSALRATGSNGIILENVLVPAELVARLDRPARIDRPLYRGFLPSIVVPGPAAIVLGVAASAIDELVELAKTKHTPTGELLSGLPRVQSAVAEGDAERPVLAFEETGAYRLLLSAMSEDPGELQRFYAETVEPLVAYDDQYETDLVQTLETFLECDGNVANTASRLFTHRHTVRYRLERVRDLSGLDVSSTDGREKLGLGLKAMRVLGIAAPRGPATERGARGGRVPRSGKER